VVVPPDDLQTIRLYVTLQKQGAAALSGDSTDFSIVVTDVASGERTLHRATFRGPER